MNKGCSRDDDVVATVLVVGPLPPPIHGAAAASQNMLDAIGKHARVIAVNNSPGQRSGRKSRRHHLGLPSDLRGHLTKTGRVARAALLLLTNCLNRRRSLYMAADGSLGIVYNIALAAVARMLGYRIFVHHHSFAYVYKFNRLMATLGLVMGRGGTHIILCSVMGKGLRGRYRSFEKSPMLELQSAAFIRPVQRRKTRRDAGLQIGFLSNLIIEKGVDTSIDLLRAARSERLPVRLILAGRMTDNRSVDCVDAALAEFGDAIEYRGALSETQKAEFFDDIDVFVFPTRYRNEAQPRAVLEPLAYGIPVLTIARGCIPTDVGPEAGICVAAGADFVSAVMPMIRSWCANPEMLADRSAAAAARAVELHALGRAQLGTVVSEICQTAGRGAPNLPQATSQTIR